MKVDDFARDAFLLGELTNGLEGAHQVSVSDESDVLAFVDHFSLFESQGVVSHWNKGFSVSVEGLGLEEDHGVWVPDGSEQ